MRLPSILTIADKLNVSANQARQIRTQFEIGRDSDNKTDSVLEKCDKILGGYGVEFLRGPEWRSYWGDTELLYVNLGDTYTATVWFDTRSNKFGVGAWGDLVERQPGRFV